VSGNDKSLSLTVNTCQAYFDHSEYNVLRAPQARTAREAMNADHFDVLIIGAGLSGIGTACHLLAEFPGKTIAVLERRERLGGTWDLFRYPGVRSDSDMFTFGYKFRPWQDSKVLADGPSIRQYIADTAADFGVDDKINYGLKVVSADWSSLQGRWTVTTIHEASGETRTTAAITSSAAPATTTMKPATSRPSPAWTSSQAGVFTHSTGPRTWTTPAKRSS
jgi:monoamine oxidase